MSSGAATKGACWDEGWLDLKDTSVCDGLGDVGIDVVEEGALDGDSVLMGSVLNA